MSRKNRDIFIFVPVKILMVCLGNICRSPLAEGILRQKLEAAGIDAVVDSCGTGNWHAGEAPDKRAIGVAAERGLDISKLCARQFRPADFREFDLIFAMDSTNYRDILSLAAEEDAKAKVHLFLPYCGINDPADVPDPWYGDKKDFIQVYQLLEKACEKAISKLLTISR